MYLVVKRDGKEVSFDIKKITVAIEKAFRSLEKEFDENVVDFIALKVTSDFSSKVKDGKITVEEIQDSVEKVLSQAGYEDVAKAYILYRKQREKIRNMKSATLDYKSVVDNYLKLSDWRVKENSTVTYSVGGLILSNSGAITANYWLSEIYDEEIANAHRNCDFHIHDLSMLTGYCAGWSLKQLIQEGLGGLPGKITSAPAKHLATLCNQMVNFLGILQNEWAGAQAFSSFDTYLAPFVKYDNLSYDQTKKCIESFVYGVNTPSRWGTQAPFSNITLDWVCPNDLKNVPAIVGGKDMDFTYGDCQKEIDMVNKAFIEVMIDGDANGRGFQYPIPTYSITKDFDWSDTENNRLLFTMTAKYGTPYFSNYINSDLSPEDALSMCCRLRLDTKELRKRGGGLFGSNPLTGSIGVVTINLPRIAYQSKSKGEFFGRLWRMVQIAKNSLEIKRKVIESETARGLYPYAAHYLRHVHERTGQYWYNHFNTIGIIGMNEACMNLFGPETDLTTPEGQAFAIEVMDYLRAEMSKIQDETGHFYNLEASPAEGTSYRLARLDRAQYPDIICAGTKETPYYTNSTQLPVGFTDDIFETLELQDELQSRYTGGTVLHLYLGERIPDTATAKALIRKVFTNYKLPYLSLTPTFSVCPKHGYIRGEHFTCPECGGEAEVWSRVVGYLRPVQNFHKGKKQEYAERVKYVIKDEQLCASQD